MTFGVPVKAPTALPCPSLTSRFGLIHSDLLFPCRLILSRLHPPRSTLALTFSRPRGRTPASTSSSSSSKKSKRSFSNREFKRDEELEEDIDEDALEALFSQLEEDLKNDGLSLDDDDDDEEISEEDLARLERELGEAFGIDDVEYNDAEESDIEGGGERNDDDAEMDEEVEAPVKLKNWQLRRLAHALKTGRRKTSIKSLAAELCLERALVLELLRDPPPSLLLMSAALPDISSPTLSVPETKPMPAISEEISGDVQEPKGKNDVPVHVMQRNWSAHKRLKKVQVETLEGVYRRTKRPTNTVINSIVQVTNLPRKIVVKWFEDKRAEDGVLETPYPPSIRSKKRKQKKTW